jgi:vacuolar protein sorting-associated protein 13A/C
MDKEMPHFDVQLLFDEIGVALDDNQYRDTISLVDMYHVYVRQHQVSYSCTCLCVSVLKMSF